MNKRIALLCCVFFFITSCCSVFSKCDDYGAALQDAIKIFEGARTKTSGNLLSLKDLTGTKPSAEGQVGIFVEQMKDRLTTIEGSAQTLKNNFNDVISYAERLFAQQFKKAEEINDPQIKEDAKNRIQRKQTKYIATLQKTKETLQKLSKYISWARDIIRVLEIDMSLQIIDKNNLEMSNIASRANDLIRELQEFTKEGLSLVGKFGK